MFVATFLLLAGLLHGVSFGTSYKVTKVIEVGPAASVPYVGGPLKWSPDGTMLAYFANNYLMISDTLGNSREVWKIDIGITPRRFEWASNDKVAINLPRHRASDSALYKTITVVDINTGQDEIVVSDQPGALKPVGGRTGRTFFEGPFLSLEGNAYYMIKTCTGSSKETPDGRGRGAETIDEAHWFFPDKAPALEDNHFIRWYLEEGLYEIALTGNDSTRIAPSPFGHIGPFAAVSPDRSYVINGGTIIRTEDSTCIVLDTIPIERPDGVVACGFGRVSFNPNLKSTEVLFELTCDGNYPSGAEFVVNRIGTFDYTTYEFTILDTLIGIESCAAPVYAPDGREIAFLDNDDYKAYIIYREEK